MLRVDVLNMSLVHLDHTKVDSMRLVHADSLKFKPAFASHAQLIPCSRRMKKHEGF